MRHVTAPRLGWCGICSASFIKLLTAFGAVSRIRISISIFSLSFGLTSLVNLVKPSRRLSRIHLRKVCLATN